MVKIPNFLHFFKQGVFPSYLGVDIGTTSIKIAEVKRGRQLPEVINYGLLESSSYLARANQALQTSTLKLFEGEVVELLKLLLAQMKPRTTDAMGSLPPFSAFTTVLDFPAMSQAEIEKSMMFQAKQYIPLPLSEVAIDWMKVGEFKDEKGFSHNQVLLISIPQENIKKYQRIFKSAGLNLKALEVEGLSLTRIFGGTDPTPTAVIDIGSRSTSLVFIEKNQLKFMGQTDYGGASLTQALASSLSINVIRAEELKRERGLISSGPNYELSTIMLPFLDVIINEVKKAFYKYENQFKDAPKIERMILSGGGANMLGIENYFEKELKLPAVKAAPFSRYEHSLSMEQFVPELNPIMSVSLGLAMREFTG